MKELDALIGRLRDGALTLDQFAEEAAGKFVFRKRLEYPETDGNEDLLDSVSNITIRSAVRNGKLTEDEAQAIFAALPVANGGA